MTLRHKKTLHQPRSLVHWFIRQFFGFLLWLQLPFIQNKPKNKDFYKGISLHCRLRPSLGELNTLMKCYNIYIVISDFIFRTWLIFFCPLSYVENISLSELQPPHLNTICYVLFGSFLHVLLMWTLFFFFFFFFLFSLALFSFLSCFFSYAVC